MIEDVKRIPYGVSNFVEVVEQNQYYVDKTMYLPPAGTAAQQSILYPPPAFLAKYLPEHASALL